MSKALILIPARMDSMRLPGKPLADICGKAMIIHVLERALEADIGPVVVATDSEEILAVVRAAGGEAKLTRADHTSGSDRIYEALETFDPEGIYDRIINLQGDLPTLAPELIHTCLAPLNSQQVDISTLACEIKTEHERDNPNVVKLVGTTCGNPPDQLRALYFTRANAPYGQGPLYHHIGLYGYQRESLARYVQLPPSPLEVREKLEQLRALENGMRIDVRLVETVPLGVDTPEDLELARQHLVSE